MGGPSCEVVLEKAIDSGVLAVVDEYLGRVADTIVRHRKGRTWEIWINGQPVRVADDPSLLQLLLNQLMV